MTADPTPSWQPLVTATDTDFTNWTAGSTATYVSMACAEVVRYCGWHIAPSLSVTGWRGWFGGRNMIMLPSTYVTAVSAVTIDGNAQVADTDYYWDSPNPWIRRRPLSWSNDGFALVDFTHGYAETPIDVKAVIAELVTTAQEMPASNATEFTTMQYTVKLRPDIGMVLTPQQKMRLGQYRIPRFSSTTAAPSSW